MWRLEPSDLATLDDWLSYASSADGDGASISRFLLRSDLASSVKPLAQEFQEAITLFGPVFDAVYEGTQGATSAPHVSTSITPAPEPPAPTRRYWVIAAGEQGRMWEDFKQNKLAAIGWDFLGNLRDYENKEAISDAIERGRDSTAQPIHAAKACHDFAHHLRQGHYVIAKAGLTKVLGIGVVEGDYTFQPDRREYRHTHPVRWLRTDDLQLSPGVTVPQKTLTDVTDDTEMIEWVQAQLRATPIAPVARQAAAEPFGIDQALDGLFLTEEQFSQCLNALRRKKNVILQGPPGVGKTFIAKRLAYALIGSRDRSKVEMVQFHQSYSYEDFIQGWRPRESGGFELRDGPFYDFCTLAAADPDQSPHVFIIDEVNRGDLSRIFGELMMLIETDYRGESFAMPLMYSKDRRQRFHVPANVYLLGMMNTADRSLAMVDYALRRRFAFVRLEPAFGTDVFRSYLARRGVPEVVADKIITRMQELNQVIAGDKNLGSGFRIGHSFFCPPDGEFQPDDDWYPDVINEEIAPLVREYWFDNHARAEELIADLLA